MVAGCNQAGKTGLMIPKEVAWALHLDLASVGRKISWQEVRESPWFAEAKKLMPDSLAVPLLENPAATGLDTDGPLVLFQQPRHNKSYLALEGKLKDPVLFRQALERIGAGSMKIAKEGNLGFCSLGEEAAVLYFDEKQFVLLADAGNLQKTIKKDPSAEQYSADSLKYFARELFSLKGKQLLDSDPRFVELISGPADLHYWLDLGNWMGQGTGGLFNWMKLADIRDGNISFGKLNFENGKIVLDSKHYFNDRITEIFQNSENRVVDENLMARLPGKPVVGAFGFSFNPSVIKELLKVSGTDGMVNAALSLAGLTVDELVRAATGDLALAITGYSIKTEPATLLLDDGETIHYEKEMPQVKYIFGAGVRDSAAFQKLIGAVRGPLQKQRFWDTAIYSYPASWQLRRQWFVMGSSDTAVAAFLNKEGALPPYIQHIKEHQGGGFLNLGEFLKTPGHSPPNQGPLRLAATWRTAQFYWDWREDHFVSNLELALENGSENSLKQIRKMLDESYQKFLKEDPAHQ